MSAFDSFRTFASSQSWRSGSPQLGSLGRAEFDREPSSSRVFEATKVVDVGNAQIAKHLRRLRRATARAAIEDHRPILVRLKLRRDPSLRCLRPDGRQRQVESRTKLARLGKLARLPHVDDDAANRDKGLCSPRLYQRGRRGPFVPWRCLGRRLAIGTSHRRRNSKNEGERQAGRTRHPRSIHAAKHCAMRTGPNVRFRPNADICPVLRRFVVPSAARPSKFSQVTFG